MADKPINDEPIHISGSDENADWIKRVTKERKAAQKKASEKGADE
jgi:hypothetical protein